MVTIHKSPILRKRPAIRTVKGLKKEILNLKSKIKKQLIESKLDKKQIEKLKKELNDLEKKYNELDDYSVSSTPFNKY
jgi:ABC-type phosphate transport system auxiliary subunit